MWLCSERMNAWSYLVLQHRCHPKDYLQLLESMSDNLQLALGLLAHKLHNKRSLLPLGVVVKTLMMSDTYDLAIKLLQTINKPADGGWCF